ncbi:MAG: glycosyltransferase family 2 protein [Ruminococcus sp.]|nr:glycosyltransferase family 2 protein [Ruminococcus sp.]
MYKRRITVFTPTYNRAYIISNLYNSIKKQTFKNFEWLVVDDGSTDNTEDLFKKWQHEDNDFVIRYYKTVNGGKHRAINRALNLAVSVLQMF